MQLSFHNKYIKNLLLIILLFLLLCIILFLNSYLGTNKINEGMIDRDKLRHDLYNDIYDYHKLSNTDFSSNKLADWRLKNNYINNIPFLSNTTFGINDFISAFQKNYSTLSPHILSNTSEYTTNTYTIGVDNIDKPVISQSERLNELYGETKSNSNSNSIEYNPDKFYINRDARREDLLKNANITLPGRKIDNDIICPINMTPEIYKKVYNLTCREPCPPGKEYNNSLNKCE